MASTRSNARQAQCRVAVGQLNRIATELGAKPVPVKAGGDRVGNLIRELDRACADESIAARVRAVCANGVAIQALVA